MIVPTNMQQTLIIADLHLTQVENDKVELFDQFCTEYASKVDQLFILGDLFNTWIGDDISLSTYQSIATILNKLTKTTQVFVMAGNRDLDRKSTRLNSSHVVISYAVFCLKKKKQKTK